MLRNRRTGTFFETNLSNTRVVPVQETQAPDAPDAFDGFLDDLKTRLPKEMSPVEKHMWISKFYQHKDEILKLYEKFNSAIALDEKQQQRQDAVKPKATTGDAYVAEAFMNTLKSLGPWVKPAAVVYAASNVAAAAAESVYTVNEGIPPGGLDMCITAALDCIQGYLTQGNQSWASILPQFSRIINRELLGELSASRDVNLAMFKGCMAFDWMGNLTSGVASSNSSGPGEICQMQSNKFQRFFATATVTNVSQPACADLKTSFFDKFEDCVKEANKDNNVTLYFAVGLVSLVIIAIGCTILNRRSSNCCKRIANGPESVPLAGAAPGSDSAESAVGSAARLGTGGSAV